MAIQQTILRRFYDNLPYKPYCSYDKRLRFVYHKRKAIGFRYIQGNHPYYVRYIILDCDYDYFRESVHREWEWEHIPGPTLAVLDPDSHYAHLFYELLHPVPHPTQQSPKTRKLMRDVGFAYKEMLSADKVVTHQRLLVKNPLSEEWDVQVGYKQFTLDEMAEYIPRALRGLKPNRNFEIPKEIRVMEFEGTLVPYSRNCSLFENGRFFAYAAVGECYSEQTLYDLLLSRLQDQNEREVPRYFLKPILLSEVRTIARSIAHWVWLRRSNFKNINKGAMKLPPIKAESREEYEWKIERRQRLAAYRTHSIQREATRRRIQEAVEWCLKHGIEPTPDNIDGIPGNVRVARSTVYYHREFLLELLTELPEPRQDGQVRLLQGDLSTKIQDAISGISPILFALSR